MDNGTTADGAKEGAQGYTPEQIYAYFAAMEVDQLVELANAAVAALAVVSTREEGEEAIIKMAPFFLDCTFPRMPEAAQTALRGALDAAEEKFGSFAKVLGLDEALEKGPSSEADPVSRLVDRLLRHELSPNERRQLARAVCDLSPATFKSFAPADRVRLKKAVARFEARWGAVEELAQDD